MWKIFGSNSRWDDHSKKMWSPLPVSRKDPVKLPFLEVTPSTVLERLKGQSPKEALEDERNPFRIWAAEPIDLSRSGEIGYRGVYLGKLRQDATHNGISMSPDKSYGILSSKHRSPSGRAHVTETVPNLTSPSTRRVNLLEPLLQGEASLTGSQVNSNISKMPPLADRLKRSPTVKRVSSSEFQSATSMVHHPPPESSEETMDDFSDDESSEEDSRRPFSNTKDSGISLLSANTVRENEKFQIPAINSTTRLSSTQTTNRSSVKMSGSTRDEFISSEENEDEVVQISLNMKRTSFEDRYDRLYNNHPPKVKAAKIKIPVNTNAFSKNNKGYASKLIPDFISRKNHPKRIENYDKSYESDFESDEESNTDNDNRKIERLRKSQLQTRRKLERKVSERNAKRVEEDRLRKYMELESRHSGTSLPLTSPNDFQISLTLPGRGRMPKTSPRDPVTSNLRISKSHDRNLNLAVNKVTPRSRSVDRSGIPIRQQTNPRSQRGNKRNKIDNQYRLRRGNNLQKDHVNLNNTFPRDMNSRRTPRTDTMIESVRMRTDSTQKPLKPFPGPHDAYNNTLNLLKSKNWESQMEGLKNLNRLSAFHEELLTSNMKEICMHLITHMRCLRSQVSRTAIQTIAQFFDKIGKEMEPHMERIVANLLHKTSDTNKFLQQDSNYALDAIVENLPTCKTVPCIINEGLGHRNAAVRATVSRLLAYSVELLGPTKSLSGQKDITEKILPAAAKLAQDGNQGCRKYAKIFFQHLVDHQNFDAAMIKYVPSDSIRNLQKLFSSITS